MDEFWSLDKLLLMIGLFQFGLILMMFMILNMGKHKRKNKGKGKDKVNKNKINTSEALTDVSNKPANNDINLEPTLPEFINKPLPTEPIVIDTTPSNPPEIDLTYKIDISPELLTELLEISNNPAAIIDEAIRWWLRRRTIDDLDSGMRDRRYPVGLSSYDSRRSQKDLWND